MTVTCKLWVYTSAIDDWMPAGTHATASSKGVINDGNAIGETQANRLQHCEILSNLRHFERAYLEVTAIGGTSTAVTAYLVNRVLRRG
jgi:hypothetical protein